MKPPLTTEVQEELTAQALGQLLRDAATFELSLQDAEWRARSGRAPESVPPAVRSPKSHRASTPDAPYPEASGTDVVKALWGTEGPTSSPLSAEDRAWMAQAELRLKDRLKQGQPSETVLSALAKARADRDPEVKALRGKARVWAGGLGLAAAALLGFVLSASIASEHDALTYSVAGELAKPTEGGRVEAPAGDKKTLAFSDGSVLELAEKGSLRVRQTDEHGAEVVVERGRLSSAVKHKEETSWSVFAGPYEIQVVGTRFTTDWDPNSQKIVVLLDEGSVKVVGADIEDHVVLKPGQRFTAQVNQTWSVTSQKAEEAATAALPLPADEAQRSDHDSLPSAAPSQKALVEPSWEELLSNGKFTDVMDLARKAGIARCINSCSISRLRTLADAARYTGELDTAEKALLSLRARSPREALRAAYLLGSMSEARGQAAQALRWYAGYLVESPGGSFAAEALGGKMRAEHALGRHSDARSSASEYLRRYPSGASAATARRILNKK